VSDDIIRRALGMDDAPEVETTAIVTTGPTETISLSEMDVDFEYVVDNLKELIAQGQETINELILIAKQSQHPRAFEVIATLMKTVADMNNDIINAHKKKNDISPSEARHTKGPANVTNNLFVGSTAELQAFLDQQKAKDR
jgi:hypothetical protein